MEAHAAIEISVCRLLRWELDRAPYGTATDFLGAAVRGFGAQGQGQRPAQAGAPPARVDLDRRDPRPAAGDRQPADGDRVGTEADARERLGRS